MRPPDKILHPVITKARNYISSLRHGRHGPPATWKGPLKRVPTCIHVIVYGVIALPCSTYNNISDITTTSEVEVHILRAPFTNRKGPSLRCCTAPKSNCSWSQNSNRLRLFPWNGLPLGKMTVIICNSQPRNNINILPQLSSWDHCIIRNGQITLITYHYYCYHYPKISIITSYTV